MARNRDIANLLFRSIPVDRKYSIRCGRSGSLAAFAHTAVEFGFLSDFAVGTDRREVQRHVALFVLDLVSIQPENSKFARTSGDQRYKAVLILTAVPMRDDGFSPGLASVVRKGKIHVVGFGTLRVVGQPVGRQRSIRQ